MLKIKTPTISVVIPTYNDADQLTQCLEALLTQTFQPAEIIVVDNNSNDDITSVVRTYSGVRLIQEPRQGVLYARTTGFNAAHGDIIARLDADSIPHNTWVSEVLRSFEIPHVAAVSGSLYFHDIQGSLQKWSQKAYRYVHMSVSGQFLAGANMAIRRSVWRSVHASLCTDNHLHEDIDIALHLYRTKAYIIHNPRMIVGTSSRRMDDTPSEYARYIRRWAYTYHAHRLPAWRVWLPSFLLLSSYPVIKTSRLVSNFYRFGIVRVDRVVD